MLVLLVGDPRDALFGFIVVANAAIGVVQEYRAKRTLDKLAVLHAPGPRVRRGGAGLELAVAEVVHDDVLLLRTGDQIPADAMVVDAEALEIDESLLTGESDPVAKPPGRPGLVRLGRGGRPRHGPGAPGGGRVLCLGSLTAEARRFSLVNSEIRNSINRIILYIAWALDPHHPAGHQRPDERPRRLGRGHRLGGLAHCRGQRRGQHCGHDPRRPGAADKHFLWHGRRDAWPRQQVLVQELPAVEGLARVDMVCLDKTGTLTEGRMELAGTHGVCRGARLGAGAGLAWAPTPTPMPPPPRLASATRTPPDRRRRLRRCPSTAPASSVPSPSGPAPVAGDWVLGAPEMVLAGAEPRRGLAAAHDAAGRGLRALVLAHRGEHWPTRREINVRGPLPRILPGGLAPVALLLFREKVRPDAARDPGLLPRTGR